MERTVLAKNGAVIFFLKIIRSRARERTNKILYSFFYVSGKKLQNPSKKISSY